MKLVEMSQKEIYMLYHWLQELRGINPNYYNDYTKSFFDKFEKLFIEEQEETRKKYLEYKNSSYEQVYCTDCKWFRLDDEEIPYCPFEDKCDINNCEDSRSFLDRPCYKSK